MGIFLVFYLIFIFKKTHLLIPIFMVLILLTISYLIRLSINKPLASGTYEGIYKVVEVKPNYILLKGNGNVVVYLQNHNFTCGDVLQIKLRVKELEAASYIGDFDSKSYYFSKGIYNQGSIIEKEYIGHQFTFLSIRDSILSFYQTRLGPKSFSYLSAILFGYNEMEEEVSNAYQSLYSAHILAISGLHIVFLNKLLKGLLQRLFKIEGSIISLVLLGIYLAVIGFPISAIRAYLFLIIGCWNRVGPIHYTRLDIYSISFLIMAVINPFWAYQQGFILSYAISFILLFESEFITSKNKLIKQFKTSILCILTTLPIVMNQNHDISLTGLCCSFIIRYALSTYLLPILVFISIFPFGFYEYLFYGLDTLLLFLNKYSIHFSYPAMNFYEIVLYFVIFSFLLISLVKQKKQVRNVFGLAIYLFFISILSYLNPFYKVTFIDVGQGDSILIEAPYGKQKILVDSYHNIDYLESLAIPKIDVLVISHFDQDHMATASEVIERWKVDTVYYPIYSKNELGGLACEMVPLKGSDVITIGGIKIEVFGPIVDLGDSNGNSLVFKMTIRNTSILFTGDCNIVEEEYILKLYSKKLKSDILKVGHHGSATSTSNTFLKAVSPAISIVSVGLDNLYGLPDETVLKRLKSASKVYLTKESGNISVWIGKNYSVHPYRIR